MRARTGQGVAEAWDATDRARVLAEQQSAKAVHDAKMEYILLQLDEGPYHWHAAILLKAGNDHPFLIKQMKDKDSVAARAERYCATHDANTRRLLY